MCISRSLFTCYTLLRMKLDTLGWSSFVQHLGRFFQWNFLQLGGGVSELTLGDWVVPSCSGLGTWQTYANISEKNLIKIDNTMPLEAAATFQVVKTPFYFLLFCCGWNHINFILIGKMEFYIELCVEYRIWPYRWSMQEICARFILFFDTNCKSIRSYLLRHCKRFFLQTMLCIRDGR